jgi:Ca-activated chloride channel family protein
MRRSAGFGASRRATVAPGSAPRPGGPARDAQPRLLAAREQIADEVAALRLARRDPDAERLRFLADLGTRLDALLTWLPGEPGGTGELAGLADLVARLRACDAPGAPRGADLDALWDEAVRLLTGFTQGLEQPPAGGAGPGGHQFWKRPR